MNDPNVAAGAPDPLSNWLAMAWAQKAEVRETCVEGVMIRYRTWGFDGSRKPGLVLVHGFAAHARWWDHIAPHFADRYRVVAPDFSGMGDSDRRDGYSRGLYAREILAVTREAGFDRATFVAHSFGSSCTLDAALLAPAMMDRAILIDGRIFRRSSAEDATTRPDVFYPSYQAARDRFRLMPAGVWPVPEVFDYIARHSIRQVDVDRWTWKFDPAVFHAPNRDSADADFTSLSVPVAFLHAAESEVVDPVDLVKIMAQIPTCGTPVTMPLSHHHVMIEQPVALVAALNGLLACPA